MAKLPQQLAGTARRPDLLPNEQEISYENLIEWLDHRKNWLIGLFGAAILAVVGVIAWRYQTVRVESDAALALTEARSIESLQGIVQRHAGTRSAVFAAMTLADVFFQQAEWDKAAALYQGVLRDHPSSSFAPAAVLGMGALEEARGNKEDALRLYRSVSAASPVSFVAPQAALAAAQLLERTGRLIEARQAYEDVASRFASSPSRMDALGRLDRLNVLLRKTVPPSLPVSLPSAPTK